MWFIQELRLFSFDLNLSASLDGRIDLHEGASLPIRFLWIVIEYLNLHILREYMW